MLNKIFYIIYKVSDLGYKISELQNLWKRIGTPLIATKQRVVAAQRQQRRLVNVTIRGSVLFYSSAI